MNNEERATMSGIDRFHRSMEWDEHYVTENEEAK